MAITLNTRSLATRPIVIPLDRAQAQAKNVTPKNATPKMS